MLEKDGRKRIKTYFYGSSKALLIAGAGLVSIIIPIIGLLICPLALTAALCIYLKERFAVDKEAEKVFDQFIENDLQFFNDHALSRLGLKREQVEIIVPITTIGPLDDYEAYLKNYNIMSSAKTHGWLATIILWPYYLIRSIRSAMKNKDIHIPNLIFKIGSDDKVRYSLCQAHIFLFSENQLYVYCVSYDICTGEFLDEKTYELFYREIDTVITGIDYRKIFYKKKIKDFRFEYFKVISMSNTSISAYVDGAESILDTQVRGMRTLIRNKKMELDHIDVA